MRLRPTLLAGVFAALACLGTGAIAAIPAATPYSRMDLPWWKNRFNAKLLVLHFGEVDLLWLGDSITQDFELSGPEPWRDFRPVWQHFYGDRHAVNLGFKGDATAHLLWRIEHGETDGLHPRLAIILIGANNFGNLHWDAAATLTGIEAVVSELHRRLPTTKILLLGVLPSIRNPWVDKNTTLLNRSLATRFGHDALVTFRDLTPLFTVDGKVDASQFLDVHLTPPDPPLHPTAQAQARIAEAIEPDVARLMGDRSKVAGSH